MVDRYVEFVAARCRPNTVIATVSDLRVFFGVIDRPPAEVTPADVFEFIAAQRRGPGDGRVVRLSDGESGLAARTIKRRLASVSGLFNYLVLCGEMAANPVPRGMATRRTGAGGRATGSPLIRTPRTLPRVLEPGRGDRACWARCAAGGTGRCSKRWCWAGCVAARCRVAARGSAPDESGGCSSRTARAAINVWCPMSRAVLRECVELSESGTTGGRGERPAVRRVERRPAWRAVEHRWARTDRAWCEDPRRAARTRRVISCDTRA